MHGPGVVPMTTNATEDSAISRPSNAARQAPPSPRCCSTQQVEQDDDGMMASQPGSQASCMVVSWSNSSTQALKLPGRLANASVSRDRLASRAGGSGGRALFDGRPGRGAVQQGAQQACLGLALLAPGTIGAMGELDQHRLEIRQVIAAEQDEAVPGFDRVRLERQAHRQKAQAVERGGGG